MKSQIFGIFALILMLSNGCHTGDFYVPIFNVGETHDGEFRYHIVSRGESLYAIAFKYGLDFRQIASTNDIDPPYTIFENQKLRLTSLKPGAKERRQKIGAGNKINSPVPVSKKSQHSEIKWDWPVGGKVTRGYRLTGNVNKGVDISGSLGESVKSAADGVVVYAGGGLRGYGKLVIVKHDERFLSAYGHNRAILVKEGDKVKGGQVVAEIGSSGLNQEMLHFEIRKDGKPEDPLNYLPNRGGAL